MMNRRQIDYFIHVAKLKSVSEAARTLHISQPAISKHISGMEEELGARLFERGPKGLELTEAGRILLESAERIQAEYSAYTVRIEALTSGKAGRLRIGVSPILTSSLLPQAMMEMTDRFPEFEFSARSELGTFDKLRSGELDIALSDLPDRRDLSWCEVEHLFVPRTHLAVRKSHPLARRRRLSLQDLAEEKWIWPLTDSGPSKFLNRFFQKQEVEPPKRRIRLHSRSMSTALLLEHDLVGMVTDHPACRDGSWKKMHLLPIDLPKATWSIALLWRKGTGETHEQTAFREIIHRIVGEAERDAQPASPFA